MYKNEKFYKILQWLFICISIIPIFFNILTTICNQVDEMISPDMSNNKNILPDGNNNIVTTHDYNVGKEIVNAIRGGQFEITLTSEGLSHIVHGSISHLKRFSSLVISTISKPISKAIGFLILKFPQTKIVYDIIKAGKVAIASIEGLVSLRLIARFEY